MKVVNSTKILIRHQTIQPKCRSRTLTTVSPKPFKDLPGLSALPIIGTLHHFIPLVGSVGINENVFEMFKVINKKYGPIVKWEGMFGRGTLVIFFQPNDYEKVYRLEESNPTRPGFQALEYYREVLHKEKFNGVYGLTTAQGADWRDFRTKVNPALLKRKLVQLYAPGLEKIAEDVIERLLKISPDSIGQDFDSEITKWSLESVALVALGSRIGCLQDGGNDHLGQKLIFCAKNVADLAFKLEFLPTFWMKDKTKTSNFKKIIEMFELQWSVSERFINEAKKKIEERVHVIPEEDQSILEKLLAIDDKVAVMMANEMLFAGIDTVAFSITGLLYQLAVNPYTQEKVREEMREGKSSRYLKACLKESLRLTPVIPANLRQTTMEHVVGGYQIPKGVFAIAPNEVLSNSDEHYLRAKEFIPERWLVQKSDPLYYGNTHPMVTLPFGFGIRSCIGRRIAEMEMEILVKKLLENTKITWTGPPIEIHTKMLNTYKKPYHFKIDTLH